MFTIITILLVSKNANDCVTRAISLATNTPYDEVKELLTISADTLNCCRICRPCYTLMLKAYYGLKPIEDGYHTIGEISDMYPDKVLLIRSSGHLSTSVPYNTIMDTWDCRDEVCTHYWIVK